VTDWVSAFPLVAGVATQNKHAPSKQAKRKNQRQISLHSVISAGSMPREGRSACAKLKCRWPRPKGTLEFFSPLLLTLCSSFLLNLLASYAHSVSPLSFSLASLSPICLAGLRARRAGNESPLKLYSLYCNSFTCA